MKKISRLLVLLLIMSMTSCAPFWYDPVAKFEEAVQSWLGHDINDLIQALGPPTDEYVMPNGQIVYTWYEAESSSIGYGYGGWYSQRNITKYCKTEFTAVDNVIIYVRWEGNICR